ncbi:MAG: sugar transporter [Mucilaginibacter sp.]|nr:sugar transporter [Mucilaginibacter sp.]
MKNYLFIFYAILLIVLSSCHYTNSSYFQGVNRNSDIGHKIENFTPLTIQSGDLLGLNVKSLNPEGSAIFDSGSSGSSSSSSSTGAPATGGGGGGSSSGYRVDQKGEIMLPLVHNIKVGGLTIAEAQNVIQQAITPYLKEPIVTLNLLNFKISILGDVSRPAVFPINDEHISIPEALSLAGDLTISGKRENILLIREINGERKFVNIDISSAQLFNSPYYYLKNNDILYVEAGKAKFASLNQNDRTLPYVLSVLSFLIVVFTFNKNYKIF